MATGGQKAPQSFTDALGDVIQDIATAKLAPDADLKFLGQLEMVVLARIKHGGDQVQPGGAQPPGAAAGGGPSDMGGPPPAGGPMPAPGGQVPPQGGPAPHPNIPQMDPDEMRRVIAETTGS